MSYTITTKILPTGTDFYVMADKSNPAEIEAAGTATLNFLADGVFFLLKTSVVEVVGASQVSWTEAAPYTRATLIISDPTANVVINITPKQLLVPQTITKPFSYKGKAPLDLRTVLTKAQMVQIKDVQMPDYYFAVCKDDSNIYIYDKSLDANVETGKFRPIDNFITFSTPEAKEMFEQAIINSDKIENIDNNINEIKTEIDELSVDGGAVEGD